jgi:hypothetical protein
VWYTVYRVGAREPVSRTTVLPDALPPGLAAVESAAPAATAERWDADALAWVAEPVPPRPITKRAFLSRIDLGTHAAIEAAAVQPTADGATIRAILRRLGEAPYVRHDSPETIALVGWLAGHGYLSSAEAATLLAPPADDEAWWPA